jgi:hypothetical protein
MIENYNLIDMYTLVAGWFSFEGMGTTAGDLIAKDIICNWLTEAEISFDVAILDTFQKEGGIDWQKADPMQYTHIIFVCGPFGNGWPITDFLSRFSMSKLVGINLSLIESLDKWNPFTLLYERDSSRGSNPDITFYALPPKIPVVGVILVHKQKEYGDRARHEVANAAVERLTTSQEMSVIKIDTALENNLGGLRTPGEVEATIARMEVVITTRLHGTVLSLKNRVPVIPIDPIAGGAKITQQVRTLEWPVLFNVENLSDKAITEAFKYTLTEEAKRQARECSQKAITKIENVHQRFLKEIKASSKEELLR